MVCSLCKNPESDHKPGCPHDKPEGSFERAEYLRGYRDGQMMDVVSKPNDYYIIGYQTGAGLR